MEMYDIFRDIAERTAGDIYIGVVGPVRTGKSTFIKRFMEQMVVPHIVNQYDRERAQDELPQSGSGKTIMTTEPKFIPSEAVEVAVGENIHFRVRLIDCVGYTVEGAAGYANADGPRLVLTPWLDTPVSFAEAAEMGTKKVINDHSTVGLVITSDGSITDLPRSAYVPAEERVISELKALGKPFVVILNSLSPNQETATAIAAEMRLKYQVPVVPLDCLQMGQPEIETVLQELLYMFPLQEIRLDFPRWVDELQPNHWLRSKFENAAYSAIGMVERVRDVYQVIEDLRGLSELKDVFLQGVDLGVGAAEIILTTDRELFFKVLEEVSGFKVSGDHHLMRLMQDLAIAKQEYDKVSQALEQVKATGYGIVPPVLTELTLAEPELIRHGNRFGVKLKASAPSIHMIRTEISAEVTPVVGTEKQSEEFAKYLTEEFEKDPSRIWQTDFFGKSMHDLIKEGIQAKLSRMPENAQEKLQETLTKIINEGSGGLICIIL